MLRIPYRNKLRLKKLGRFLLIALGLLFLGAVLILVYADSLIQYDRDGAHFVGEMRETEGSTISKSPRPEILEPTVVLQEKEAEMTNIADLGGVYISTKMLKDMDTVTQLLRQIQEPCAVMMELKSIFGNFYYTTDFAFDNYAEGIDIEAVDALIAELQNRGFYLIASVPAFPDRAYVLENESLALKKKGGYGWMDSRGCYWLDPSLDGSISRLMQIAYDLADRGFREVCFTEFQFPQGDKYRYGSELPKEQIIQEKVESLTGLLAGSDILVSFETSATSFPAQACDGRIYVPDADVAKAETYAQQYSAEGGAREVVFLTASKDERFEKYAVLKPLMAES